MKYIYMLGYGRSGSTLIESHLTELTHALAVGEVKYLVERGLLLKESCSCGKTAEDCLFWSKIIDLLATNSDENFLRPSRLEEVAKSVNQYESTILLIKNILLNVRRNKDLYLASQRSILAAIEEGTDNEVIIDSSKMPARLYWLKKELDIDPVVLFVVRDPRAVAWSCARVVERKEASSKTPDKLKNMPRFGFISSVLRWGINTAISLLVLKLTKVRYLIVKYEDFVVDNGKEVSKIEHFLTESLHVHADDCLPQIHSISGNPRRMTEGFGTLQLDEEWKKNVSQWRKMLAYFIVFPLMVKLGYKL